MPFDAAVQSPRPRTIWCDPLVTLGVTPLSKRFVEAYKANVVKEFAARSRHRADLVEMGMAKWLTAVVKPKHFAASEFCSSFAASDTSLPPSEIVDLARSVHGEVPDVAFELDFFYDDPVLHAVYRHNYQTRRAALGIWDQGNLIALAGIDGKPPFPTSAQHNGFFGRLFIERMRNRFGNN